MNRGRRGERGGRREPARGRSRGPAAPDVESAVRATIDRFGLIRSGDRVLAACSGGPDSMALLALLLELRAERGFDVVVAHFDHRLRPDSAVDRDFVRAFARARGLRFIGGRRDVRRHAARLGLNLEEAARELRYAFLRRAAVCAGAVRIATGHTMDDQAETVLLRLLRGTGLSGLAGIAVAGEDGLVVRPLLEIERADLRAWLRRRGLPFRRDPTNLDRRRLRNRIRLDLLPRLAREYDPAVVRHLARLAALAQDEDAVMAAAGRRAFRRVARPAAGRLALDAAKLARLPRGLARRAGREFLRAIKGDLRGFGAADVEALLELRPGESRTLRSGLRVRRDGGAIAPARPLPRGRAVEYRREWDGRSELAVPEAGLSFRGRFLRAGRAAPPYDDARRAVLDAAAIGFPLEVRSRRPGDRYRPLGAPGRKTLKDLCRERGVPAAARATWPVFVSAGEIVWTPGAPVADRARVGPGTRSIFVIEVRAQPR